MPIPFSGNFNASGPVRGRPWKNRRYAITSAMAPRNANRLTACVCRPQIAIAIAPPPTEPASPIATVSQTGIGSGPGTASRARPPVMKPEIRIRMTVPSTGASILGRCRRARGRDELAPELLDLVAQLGRVLEAQFLRRGEHLLLELDDQPLELPG